MIVEMEKYVQQTTLTITHQWDKKIMLGNFMILGCLEVARFLFQTYFGYSYFG
jgi:hypothetical protein